MIDFNNLQKMIDEKYISMQKHPELDLFIYNYTQKAQFDQVWNNETMQCRGLILDGQKRVVSRPFPKFFNYQEIIDKGGQIPAEDFIVTEKMDGSLGVSYFVPTDMAMRIATRGSFVSDQAFKAQQIFNKKYQDLHWNSAYTYLFEIIYPENRIVVDYGRMEDLVLLAVIDTYTGEEFPYEKLLEWYDGKLPIVKKYDAIRDFSNIEQRPNSEGYVIAFPSSKQRMKIKFEEYVRLHRLITGVNKRRIWDILRSGGDLSELLDRVPDEFFKWVKDSVDDLNNQFKEIREEAGKVYVELIESTTSRKEFALEAQKHPRVRAFLFMMRDNKPEEVIASAIWRTLKPKHETPFKIEI